MFKSSCTLRSCSVCKGVYNPNDANDISRHDSVCPVYKRKQILREQIDQETKRQRMLGFHGCSSTFNRLHDCVVVDGTSLEEGAYTSKMTQGITSVQLAEFQTNYEEYVEKQQTQPQSDNHNDHSKTSTEVDDVSKSNMIEDSVHVGFQLEVINNEGGTNETSLTNENVGCLIDDSIEISPSSLVTLANRRTEFGIHFSSPERKYLKLMKILSKINAPFHAFDSIMKWARTLGPTDLDAHISRQYIIETTASKFGIRNLFPTVHKLILPSGNTVEVTKFCFITNLFSLLTDETLMHTDNLIHGSNFRKQFHIDETSHRFEDLGSGRWMVDTQFKVVNSDLDWVIPIVLYIDKTYVKSKPAEPISFTLGIFKRHVRNDPAAWRNMGMIPGKLGDLVPNKERYTQSKLAEIRLNDWHAVCNFILSDFKRAQKQGGLHWQFNNERCKIHIPLMFIIGDIEGHDKVCSRKAGHTKMMKAVTHSCDVRREVCGDPQATCRYFEKDEISSLQNIVQDASISPEEKNGAISRLNHFGFYSDVKNAFADLDFGSNRFGIHGACAICLMHTFKQKFPNAAAEIYFLIYSKTKDSKNRLLINRSVTKLIPWVLRQSYRGHPSLNSFSVSLLKPRYSLSADEKFARVFALFLFCQTTYGWNVPIKSKNKLCDNMDQIKLRLSLLEDVISIYYFLSRKSFHIQDVDRGKKEVKSFLRKFKNCVEYFDFEPEYYSDDSEGSDDSLDGQDDNEGQDDEDEEKVITDRCTFPKFHYLLHVIDMIVRFGSASNFDGGMNESHHKTLTKAPGSRTQRRTDKFDEQTSNNLASNIVLEKAFRFLKRGTDCNANHNSSDSPLKRKIDDSNITLNSTSSKFTITNDFSNIQWTKKTYKLSPTVFSFLKTELKKEDKKHKIDRPVIGFTDLNWKGTIIRAHPSYRKKEWYDWVTVQWNVYHSKRDTVLRTYYCPAKVLLFIQKNNNLFAVVHSTEVDEKTGKPLKPAKTIWKQRGSSKVVQFWTMEKNFRLINVRSINGIAYVYPDFDDEEMTHQTKYKIEIKNREQWENKHCS